MKVLGFQIEINGTQRAINTSEELRRAISDINRELKKANDPTAIKELEKELVDLKARQREVNAETREAIKERQREITAVDKASGTYSRLSKELNDARKRYKDLAAAEQESTQEARDLLRQITALDGKLKDIDASVGQFQRNVGNYPGALQPVVASLNDIRNASGAATKALGVAAVAFQLFNIASDAIDELNASLEETRAISTQIQTFTGATGEALQTQVAQAKAVANTYKVDVLEVVNAANAASKEFGISFVDALDSVEVGLRRGANAQGDFLSNLREYPSQLAQAGFSLDEFTAISIDAAEKGVYSDKAIDAIKEFAIQTREQTKSVQDSFNAAFGEQFTSELFSNLDKGAITGRDALARVTKQIRETGVAGKELQGLVSTVFVGAGEDAGRYILSLDQVLNSTNDILTSTTEYQAQLGELFQANLDLENAQKGYTEALSDFSFELEVAKTRARTFFAEFLAGALRLADRAPAVFKGIGNGIREAFSTGSISGFITGFSETFSSEVQKIEDENELQKAVLEQLNPPENAVRDRARRTASTTADELIKGSVAEIEKRKGDLDKAFERAVAGSDAQAAIAANLKKVNEELAAAIEEQNRILFEAERRAVAQQLQGISELVTTALPTVLESAGDTTKIVLDDIKKVVAQTNEAIQQTTDIAKVSFDEIATASENVFSSALQVLGAFQEARSEREQEAFDAQLEQIDANIDALEEKQQNAGRIRAKQIQLEIDAAKRQREAAEKQAEEAQKKAAKREKTAALLQAVIQGALAVTRALAAPPGFPFNLPSVIAAGAFAAAQVATIAAQPLATGGRINGKVGNRQNIPTQANGDNVLVKVKSGGFATVEKDEIVLNKTQQRRAGGAPFFRAIGVPGFADGGVIGAPAISSPVAAMPGTANMEFLQAIDQKTDAINARIDRLQAFVVSEDIRNDLNEGDRLRIEATL